MKLSYVITSATTVGDDLHLTVEWWLSPEGDEVILDAAKDGRRRVLIDSLLAPAGATKDELELLLSERARDYVKAALDRADAGIAFAGRS